MHTSIEITKTQLRNFSLIMAAGLILFLGLLIPWIWKSDLPLWPWIAAAVFAFFGLQAPDLLRPVYRLWMAIGEILGWINSRILLGIVFFAIIFPISLITHLFGYDPMAKRFDPKSKSYRIKSVSAPNEQLEKPF